MVRKRRATSKSCEGYF